MFLIFYPPDITAEQALLRLPTNYYLWRYDCMFVLNDPDELQIDEARGNHGDIRTFDLTDEILRQKSLFSKTDEAKILFFCQISEKLLSGHNYFVYITESMRSAVIFEILVRPKSKILIFVEKFGSFLERSSSRRNPTADRVKLSVAPEAVWDARRTASPLDLVFLSDYRTEVGILRQPP